MRIGKKDREPNINWNEKKASMGVAKMAQQLQGCMLQRTRVPKTHRIKRSNVSDLLGYLHTRTHAQMHSNTHIHINRHIHTDTYEQTYTRIHNSQY